MYSYGWPNIANRMWYSTGPEPGLSLGTFLFVLSLCISICQFSWHVHFQCVYMCVGIRHNIFRIGVSNKRYNCTQKHTQKKNGNQPNRNEHKKKPRSQLSNSLSIRPFKFLWNALTCCTHIYITYYIKSRSQ